VCMRLACGVCPVHMQCACACACACTCACTCTCTCCVRTAVHSARMPPRPWQVPVPPPGFTFPCSVGVEQRLGRAATCRYQITALGPRHTAEITNPYPNPDPGPNPDPDPDPNPHQAQGGDHVACGRGALPRHRALRRRRAPRRAAHCPSGAAPSPQTQTLIRTLTRARTLTLTRTLTLPEP